MPALIELTIPEATPLLNTWQRMHWAQRRKTCHRWALLILAALGPQRPVVPLQRVRVEVTRHSAGSPDLDGLYGGLKPVLDALVRPSKRNPHGLGVIEDDSQLHLAELVARSARAFRGQGYTRIVIEELGDSDPAMAEELGADVEAAA